jgi:hypothetical protein
MSIHDFHSKFVSCERNTLFAALRRLSAMENPQRLIALATTSQGWPVWDQAGAGSPPAGGFASLGA